MAVQRWILALGIFLFSGCVVGGAASAPPPDVAPAGDEPQVVDCPRAISAGAAEESTEGPATPCAVNADCGDGICVGAMPGVPNSGSCHGAAAGVVLPEECL